MISALKCQSLLGIDQRSALASLLVSCGMRLNYVQLAMPNGGAPLLTGEDVSGNWDRNVPYSVDNIVR